MGQIGKFADNAAKSNRALQYLLLGLQVVVIVVLSSRAFHTKVNYAKAGDYTEWAYGHFQDVHVMIFVGFGFLMTFLKDYNWSSVGFNFLLAAVAIEWHYVVDFAINQKLEVDYATMFNCEFAAGAVLISFGALLGKVSHLQLVIMALFEIVIYKLNEHTALHWLHLGFKDVGGSMIIHAFGAYFGLAASRVLHSGREEETDKEGADYKTDLFAMIGTIFLWMYWPSFNGIPETDAYMRQIIAINTYTALAAACITTFAMSGFSDEKGANRFDMVHIQNATLAGGVAMGSSADFQMGIGGAVIIGTLAGAISTVGYQLIQSQVLKKLKIHDTCGVHNLHGMPGVMGALFSMIFGTICADKFSADAPFSALAQLYTLLLTLVMAIVGGTLTGFVMKFFCSQDEATSRELFEDAEHWTKEE